MPLNDSNFLMWFGPNESPTAPPLPRPFVREPDALSPVVWLLAGEDIAFYINSLDNTGLNSKIQLQHERSGAFKHDLTQARAVIDFPNGQHVYGNLTAPNLPEGLCRLTCGNYTSQWLWLSTPERAADRTALVRFGNSGHRLQNIRYGLTNEGWMQQFRIRLAVRSETSASNKEVYDEATTGKRRNYYSEPGWIVGFSTAEYDRWGHRAMASLLEHDSININGKAYTFQSGYKANLGDGDALSTGEFELRDEAYSSLHRS